MATAIREGNAPETCRFPARCADRAPTGEPAKHHGERIGRSCLNIARDPAAALVRSHTVTCLVTIGPAAMLALCVFEGRFDGPRFLAWLREWLVPSLPAGTTVRLDMLSVHRGPAVRRVIEASSFYRHCGFPLQTFNEHL